MRRPLTRRVAAGMLATTLPVRTLEDVTQRVHGEYVQRLAKRILRTAPP